MKVVFEKKSDERRKQLNTLHRNPNRETGHVAKFLNFTRTLLHSSFPASNEPTDECSSQTCQEQCSALDAKSAASDSPSSSDGDSTASHATSTTTSSASAMSSVPYIIIVFLLIVTLALILVAS